MKQNVFFCILILSALLNCDKMKQSLKPTKSQIPADAVASVNDGFITKSEFDQKVKHNDRFNPAASDDNSSVIDELVTDELLFQKAIELKLHESPQIKRMMVRTLTRDHIDYNKTVSDEELQAYYDGNQSEFMEIQASHILIKADKRSYEAMVKNKKEGDVVPKTYEDYLEGKKKAAEEIKVLVRQDPDKFADIAKETSEGPSKVKGGDLGYFTKNRMVPEFADASFALENIGDISEVVQTKFGYHVIKLTDRRVKPFDKQKVLVKSKIIKDRKDKAHETFVANLKKNATVKIFENKL